MPYPYSYTHEVDLGLQNPERFLSAAAAAATARGMQVLERAPGRLVVECSIRRVIGDDGTAPTIVPARLTLVAGSTEPRRIRVRATFGAAVALGAALPLISWLGAFVSAPRASLSDLPVAALVTGFLWLLLYLCGILGARIWIRHRVEEARAG